MLARFPAGLVIYWSWNNLLSIAQQWVIMRRTGAANPTVARYPPEPDPDDATARGGANAVRAGLPVLSRRRSGCEQLPPPACPRSRFAGRSNVGKSTLVNALTGRKRWRASPNPGARATEFFDLGRLMLVDLPGYGYARAVEGSQGRLAGA